MTDTTTTFYTGDDIQNTINIRAVTQTVERIVREYEAAGGFDLTTPPTSRLNAIAAEARLWATRLSSIPTLSPLHDIMHRIAYGAPA